MMNPLQVTWLSRKCIIYSFTNTSGPSCTNKWTRTVFPAWFVKELEWSVGSNQGSFSPPYPHKSRRGFLYGLYYWANRNCCIQGYVRRNPCDCRQTLQNMFLHTLPLRYDSRRISRSHHARSHTIAWSTFSNHIWSWIAFHLPVVGKPNVPFLYWATI